MYHTTMHNKTLSDGAIHKLPTDLAKRIRANSAVLSAWEGITPLARNEWICLVDSAKQIETRERRIERTISQLSSGKRRPCCWAGCPHREKTGR